MKSILSILMAVVFCLQNIGPAPIGQQKLDLNLINQPKELQVLNLLSQEQSPEPTNTPSPSPVIPTDTPTPPSQTDTPIPSETPVPDSSITPPAVPTDATATPDSSETITETPTETPTETLTPSVTPTVTETVTETPSTPTDFVLENDDDEAEVDENGATLIAQKGQVKIHFPKDKTREKIKVNVRKVDPSIFPTTLLSQKPFEITAHSIKDGQEVKKFKEKLVIEFDYSVEHVGGFPEEDLSLFYFNEEEMAWLPVPSIVDTKKHTIRGISDHLTVFDFDATSWDPSYLPSTKESQISSYTGGASYSYPIELPPFPGGSNPLNLALNYSSQAVDEMTITSQASQVGAGWSFDLGYVVNTFHGGMNYAGGYTYSINLNGATHQLWIAADGYYHTEDETYIRVNKSGDYFYAYDKDGNQYTFGPQLKKARQYTDSAGNCKSAYVPWKYPLSKIKTPTGNVINISYTTVTDTWISSCSTPTTFGGIAREVRPISIDYVFADGTSNEKVSRYRVEFEYAPRLDFLQAWSYDSSRSSVSKNKLIAINIKRDVDGQLAGSIYTYDEIIRRYELYYAGDVLPDNSTRTEYVFPSHNWDGGSKTLTLVQIRKLGHQATGIALPPTDFYYEDGMHLTKVTNGYGAEVLYDYEAWADVGSNKGRSWWDYIGVGGNGYSCSSATDMETRWDGDLDCNYPEMTIFGKATYTLPSGLIRPGAIYRFVGKFPSGAGYPKYSLYVNGMYTPTDRVKIDSERIEGYIKMPIYATASSVKIVVDCGSARCGMDYFMLNILPTYYRVTENHVKDSTTSGVSGTEEHTVTRYRYDEPATNSKDNSNMGGTPYTPQYGEYRGNAVSEAETWSAATIPYTRCFDDPYQPCASEPITINENANTLNNQVSIPDNVSYNVSSTMTWFYQTDALKGKPAVVLQRGEKTEPDNPVDSRTPMHDTFETLDSTIWNGPQSGLTAVTTRVDGDSALRLESSGGVERSISRNSGRYGGIQPKESVLLSFRINDNFGSKLYLENGGNQFGLCVTPGSPTISLYDTNGNPACDPSQAILPAGVANIGNWYSALIILDSIQPSVWVWSQDDPSIQAFRTGSGGKGGGWNFVAATAGILDIDNYSEGQVYSMKRYEYTTSTTNVTTKPVDSSTGDTYTGIAIYWAGTHTESMYSFDGGQFTATQKEYLYDPSDQVKGDGTTTQYGEATKVIEKEWDGSNWKPYRLTQTRYRSNDNGIVEYLVVPVRQTVYSCPENSDPCELNGISPDNLIGDTQYLYDNVGTQYDHSPSSPLLVGTRKLASVDPAGGPFYIDSSMSYDAYGNVSQTTNYVDYGTSDQFGSNDQQTKKTCYTGWFQGGSCTNSGSGYVEYPQAEEDASGRQIKWSYDFAIGKPVAEIAPNGAVTYATYDGLGRMLSIIRPGDTAEKPTISIDYNDDYLISENPIPQFNGLTAVIKQKIDDNTAYEIRKLYSSTGLRLQTQIANVQLKDGDCGDGAHNPDICDMVTDYKYDAFGNVVQSSVPTAIIHTDSLNYIDRSQGQPVQKTIYDASGLVRQVINQDGTVVTNDYGIDGTSQVTEATDPNNNITTTYKDARGRLLKTIAAGELESLYTYDSLDRLVEASVEGIVSRMSYDLAGRKIGMDDPDLGSWTYHYDSLGNLDTQTDARNCTTKFIYDTLNRVTQKEYSGSCSQDPVQYTYDEGAYGIGQRTGMQDDTGITHWYYDARGRLISEQREIDGVGTFTTSQEYNSADLLTAAIYPASLEGDTSERIEYTYSPEKIVSSITSSEGQNLLHNVEVDQNLNVSKRTFGSSLVQENTYYPWTTGVEGNALNRLYTVKYSFEGGSTSTLHDVIYEYDLIGNIKKIELGTNSGKEKQEYNYDNLYRLNIATVTGGDAPSFTEAYTYGLTGNLASKTVTKGNVVTTDEYHYGLLTDHPHAVKSVGDAQYSYDQNGNMTSRKVGRETFTLVYDAENRLMRITRQGGETILYKYDGDGKLIRRTEGQKNSIYIGNYAEYEYEGTPSDLPTVTPVVSTPVAPATPTATRTPLQTITTYPTATVTRTPTTGPTRTKTPPQLTFTATPTPIKSPFKTRTPDPVLSKTPTRTPVRTATNVWTATPNLPSPTPTPSLPAPTVTRTPVQWPTLLPSLPPTSTPTATAVPTSVLPNGGFETGVSPWTNITSSNLTNGGAHSGNHAVKITTECAGSTWVSVNRGQPYTLKAWYKWNQLNGSQSGTDGIKVYNYDWSEAAKVVELHTSYSQNTWSEVSITFTPTTDKVYIEFGLFGAQDAVEIYFDDLSLTTLSSTPPTSTGPRWKFYYYSGSERIAMRVRDSSSNNLYYLINDQISSTSKVVDENGNIFSETRYYPFGGTRFVSPNDAPTDLRYTGQRQEIDTGLYFYGFRWYDPYLNRFLSPDSIVPDPNSSLDWDRYSYARNNPIRYSDPTGHMVDNGCRSENCDLDIPDMLNKKKDELIKVVGNGQMTDLEAFAQLVDYAALQTPDCIYCVVDNLGSVLTGDTKIYPAFANEYMAKKDNTLYDEHFIQSRQIGQTGFAPVFQDPGEGGNQPHHFWFYVQTSFQEGLPAASSFGVILHETLIPPGVGGKSYQDVALGFEGVRLGAKLRYERINAGDIGNYLRSNLSETSSTANFWRSLNLSPYWDMYNPNLPQ